MTRWLFTIASIVSLVLFVCSAAVCIRSQFRSDDVGRVISSESAGTAAAETEASIEARRPSWANSWAWYDERSVYSDRGGIVFDHQRMDAGLFFSGSIPPNGWYYDAEDVEDQRVHFWPTYETSGSFVPPNSNGYGFSGNATLKLPYWLLLCVFAILPAVTITRAIRNRARPRGVCRKCGYDLRASTERCPECGTPISRKAEARA